MCLVGAGPGDEGLITVRGLERLRRADVVVYDALSNPSLLSHTPAPAQRIDVGKRAKAHKLTQDQINELLAQKARDGCLVVRLKGGDPYLFGRGAEEMVYLAQQGIECEVVPGVTAGVAVPAAAGIPVTHRRLASTVTLITGHEDPIKEASSIDYRSLVGLIQAGGTACFYMGVGRLRAICETLAGHGLSNDTPVSVVQWGTTPRQRTVRADLRDAPQAVADAGLGAPAIIVVGLVAAMDEPGLDYFTRRPLFAQHVVITRTRHQASILREKLDELGAITHEAPTIQLVPPDDWSHVDSAIQQINRYDWLVLTSVNGVSALAQRLTYLGLDARHLAGDGLRLAAIGNATAAALGDQLCIQADFVPTRFVAESLAGELVSQQNIRGQRFLLLRADIARPALPRMLADAGASVDEHVAYQTRVPDRLPDGVINLLRDQQVAWVTFTSSSTVKNLITMLGDDRGWLDHAKIASIGPITTQTLREFGLNPTVEAQTSNIDGLVDAMIEAAAGHATTCS